MIRAFTRRTPNDARPDRTGVTRDPSARFAYDLATKPPTKDVASVKAASDLYEANLRPAGESDAAVRPTSEADLRKRDA